MKFSEIIKSVLSLNLKSKILLFSIFLIIVVVSPLIWYKLAILPVSKNSNKVAVSIPLGSGASKIAAILKENDVIKSPLAFKIYIKLEKISNLQAGNYSLDKNMSIKEIIGSLKTGKVGSSDEFNVTFVEGKNMRWIAKKIESVTNNSEEDVYSLLSDQAYVDELINSYWFLSDDIKSNDIYYSLEGYLFPDTYTFKNKDITVKEIFKLMLDQMDVVLSKYKTDILDSSYSVHKILTMASIVELEGIHDYDKKDIASVFYNRINLNMSLGSDVTTYYAFKVDIGQRDLYQSELSTYNPYNTRGPKMNGKLPIGPIASVGKNSIEAAVYPAQTDYIFFVADKNGKVYFSKTNDEHTAIVNELKTNGLWIDFE